MATVRCILDRLVDHMPHRTQILPSNEKVVLKVLPATWKWKKSIPKINTVNSAFGLKDVSISNMSKIKKLNFPEYDANKPGDNFACFSTYNRLHSLQMIAISGFQATMF
jgi:hypothetical protein